MIALLAAAALSVSSTAEVKTFAQAFDDAQFNHDGKSLDAMIAPDFVFVLGSGKVVGKREFVEAFSSKTERYDPFVIGGRLFIPLGPDAAIVGGEARLSGEDGGQRFNAHFQYSDIFQRRNGKWQAVYTQVTSIPGK